MYGTYPPPSANPAFNMIAWTVIAIFGLGICAWVIRRIRATISQIRKPPRRRW